MGVDIKVPTLDDVNSAVKAIPNMAQFKNALDFVQKQTNVSLDRVIAQLDVLGAQCYLEGYKHALQTLADQAQAGELIETSLNEVSSTMNVAGPANVGEKPAAQFHPIGEATKDKP